MASRNFRSQFAYGYAVPVTLRAKMTFASGVASIAANTGMGIASITHNSTGDYSIALQNTYNALLDVRAVFESGNAAPAGPILNIRTDSSSSLSAPLIRVQFRDFAGALADPADTDILHISIELNNSSTAY